MSSYIESWNSLETVGQKGKGFYPNTDRARNAGRIALKYASIVGTAFTIGLAIYNLVTVLM